MEPKSTNIFEFGPFRLDAAEHSLTRDGAPVQLTPKAFDTLLLLVENSGHVLRKDELLGQVWQGAFVEDGSLAVNVFALRKALGKTSNGNEYIQTVPKRGYRFAAEVRTTPPLSADVVASEAPVVVVLPMRNLTGNQNIEHITDGFTEEIINQLAKLDPRELSVIARTSAMTFKNGHKTIREIASELHIDYAVESSLRSAGDRMTITAQLVRTDRQTYLWAKDYDAGPGHRPAVRSEIARIAAREISMCLAPKKARLLAEVSVDPAVYELYLKGRFFCNKRTGEGLRRGIEYFEQALAADPTYAPAYSGMAACWVFWSLFEGQRPMESFPKARECARRALELNPDLSEAHAALGMVHAWHDFSWSDSEREFIRSIELEPGNTVAHTWYAFFLGAMGRHDAASVEIRSAVRLDPLSWAVRAVYAFLEEWAGRGHAAIVELEKALELNPTYYFARMLLGYYTLTILGNAPAALEHLHRAYEDSGRQPDALSALGCIYAAVGMRREALEALDELSRMQPAVSPFFFARIHILLGNTDLALDFLEAAYEERFFWLMLMQYEPCVRRLAGHPRYEDLVRRMAFPPI